MTIEKPRSTARGPAPYVIVRNQSQEALSQIFVFRRYISWVEGMDAGPYVMTLQLGEGISWEIDLADAYAPMDDDEPAFFGPHSVHDPGAYSAECLYSVEHNYGGVVEWVDRMTSVPVAFAVQ